MLVFGLKMVDSPFGDASSSSSKTDGYRQNTAIGKTIDYNTWHTVELIVYIGDGATESFGATWYVDGEHYGYSNNYNNESGDITTQINNTVPSIRFHSQASAAHTMYLANVGFAAYDEYVKPDVVKTWDFEDAENLGVSINTGDAGNNTFSAAVKDEHNALGISKHSTSQNAKYLMSLGESYNAEKAILEFDIFIGKDGTSTSSKHLAYIFLRDHTNYKNSPYGAMIYGYADGFTFGDNTVTTDNTTQRLGGYLSYDEWHSVRLEIVTGGADEFMATWYVDGELYAISTKYIGEGEASSDIVDTVCIWVQGGPTMNAYIDNVTLSVYEK